MEIITFGAFRLRPASRMLEKDGIALEIGSRALDILIVLVERAGKVVSGKELVTRVWRGLIVESSSLRVHMTALRKVLCDHEATRYILNVRGQGYSFVAPVTQNLAYAQRPCIPWTGVQGCSNTKLMVGDIANKGILHGEWNSCIA